MITETQYQSIVEIFSGMCVYYPPTLDQYKALIRSGVDDHLSEDNSNECIQMLQILNRLMLINSVIFPNEITGIAKKLYGELFSQALKHHLPSQS